MSKKEIKKELAAFLKEKTKQQDFTIEELAAAVPAFAFVLKATEEVSKELDSRQPPVEHIAFWTGQKGTRVLLLDDKLWRKAPINRSADAGDAGVALLSAYIGETVLKSFANIEFDGSVYGKGKGLKPDYLAHPVTQIYPVPLKLHGSSFSSTRTLSPEPNKRLREQIHAYWQKLFGMIPDDAPDLVLGKFARPSLKRKHSAAQAYQVSSKYAMVGDSAEFPDKAVMSYLLKNCLPADFVVHDIKNYENRPSHYVVVPSAAYKYCHLKGEDHSSSGKAYFLIDTVKHIVQQKCHSSNCEGIAQIFPALLNLTDDQTSFYQAAVKKGDEGMAEIFANIARNDIKITAPLGAGESFIWNPQSALWDEGGGLHAKNQIGSRLRPVCETMMYLFGDHINHDAVNDDMHDEVKINQNDEAKQNLDPSNSVHKYQNPAQKKKDTREATWSALKQKCGSIKWWSCIYEHARTLMQDVNFKGRINHVPYLFPIRHRKVVDLRDGIVRERTREDCFTFECPVTYGGPHELVDMTTADVERFFRDVMQDKEEMVRFMQRQLGYFITGEMSDRSIFMWHGIGSNGKGCVATMLELMCSEFFITASKDVVIKNEAKQGDGAATPHLIPLVSARIGMFSETEAGDMLNEALLKKWCGNDSIAARGLYGKQFSFKPQTKLVMQTNHKPDFNTDKSMTDRLKIVKFGARFRPIVSSPDETLSDPAFITALYTEHTDQFFRWVLKGSIEWYRTKDLDLPECAKEDLNEYVEDLDFVAHWIAENCTLGQVNCKQNAKLLYNDFAAWSKFGGTKCCHKNAFRKNLAQRGIHCPKIVGDRVYDGICVSGYSYDDDPDTPMNKRKLKMQAAKQKM
jgi:P4 family phage/plasmid primase-like protien